MTGVIWSDYETVNVRYTHSLMEFVSRSTHTMSDGGSNRSKYLESTPEHKIKTISYNYLYKPIGRQSSFIFSQ